MLPAEYKDKLTYFPISVIYKGLSLCDSPLCYVSFRISTMYSK